MNLLSVVEKVNQLSVRWASTFGDQSVVASGLGAWVLLVSLLEGADGAAREELEAATGLRQNEATVAIENLFGSLDAVDGLKPALAIWVRDSIELLPEFISKSTRLSVGAIPQCQSEFDRWASDQTDGLISKFPFEVDPDSLLVLASAMLAKGTWETPFFETEGFLSVSHFGFEKAAVVKSGDTTISRIVIAAKGDLDVHLIAGSETDSSCDVISAGLAELLGEAEIIPGENLEEGESHGCLKAILMRGGRRMLSIRLPQFEVSSSHDLIERADLFGLRSGSDSSKGHFPGISKTPLAISKAAQTATMAFGPEGFEAAAISALRFLVGSKYQSEKSLSLKANFEGPFGFIVIQRSTQLALFTGWVTDSSFIVNTETDDA